MNRFRRAIVPAVLLAASCAPVADAPAASRTAMADGDTAVVRDAVSRAWRGHIDGAIRKDLGAVLDIYAEEIVYIVEGSPEVRGREAIAAMEARTLADYDVLSAEHTIDALRVFGDVAYELGTVIGPIRPKDGEPQSVTFHFMAMWRRQADGAWRIAHMAGGPTEE